jgi:hypothetical protein
MAFAPLADVDWPNTIGAVTALIVAVTALLGAFAKLWQRDNVTDKRVDLLWQANLRRGAVEAVTAKLIEQIPQNATTEGQFMRFAVDKKVIEAFKPIAPVLKELWRETSGDQVKFVETLEQRHGQWLQKHICMPLGVKEYACIEMAKLVACDAPVVAIGA